MKFLFLKKALNWPRSTGHDVHTFEMARALAGLGHVIGFATVIPPSAKALEGLTLDCGTHALSRRREPSGTGGPTLSYLQRRFIRYWGIDSNWLSATAELVEETPPDVVVAAGLDMLPCLAAVQGPVRVWYAADDYALHHLTQLKLLSPGTWRHAVDTAIAALYERCFARAFDRAWVVSAAEAWAMRFFGGARNVDVAANGVDGEHFCPGDEPQAPRSCVFWGRLDAGPNVQALQWFVRRIWPAVRREFSDASFSIYGFAPTADVRDLAGNGITVVGDVPDLRPEVRRHQVAVMPFVSGGGIKNKLLEAAALGMPIVASPRGCVGLDARGGLPLVVARRPAVWHRALHALWGDSNRREKLGSDARAWVLARHSWEAAARAVLAGLGAVDAEVTPCRSN